MVWCDCFYVEENSQIDWKKWFQAFFTNSCRPFFVICLYDRLNGPLFHCTLCDGATRCIVMYLPIAALPLQMQFCVFSLVSCVLWFNRTFPGELSAFWGQTVCCPLWCFCREPVLWEQLFREQILINGRVPEVCIYFSSWSLVFLLVFLYGSTPLFFLCLYSHLYIPTVAWPFAFPGTGLDLHSPLTCNQFNS